MAIVVNIHEAKANLATLVERAAAGEEITIAYLGKPMARPTRLPSKTKKLRWGKFKGKIEIAEDVDAPSDMFQD